eukprot:jgi/Chlat1/3461/Chrsp23S03833
MLSFPLHCITAHFYMDDSSERKGGGLSGAALLVREKLASGQSSRRKPGSQNGMSASKERKRKQLADVGDNSSPQSSSPSSDAWAALPRELLAHVFQELCSARDLAAAAQVCRDWSRVASTNDVWRPLFFACFGDHSSVTEPPEPKRRRHADESKDQLLREASQLRMQAAAAKSELAVLDRLASRIDNSLRKNERSAEAASRVLQQANQLNPSASRGAAGRRDSNAAHPPSFAQRLRRLQGEASSFSAAYKQSLLADLLVWRNCIDRDREELDHVRCRREEISEVAERNAARLTRLQELIELH